MSFTCESSNLTDLFVDAAHLGLQRLRGLTISVQVKRHGVDRPCNAQIVS
jgi:hypothetical protein